MIVSLIGFFRATSIFWIRLPPSILQDSVGADINTNYAHCAVCITKLEVIDSNDLCAVYIDYLFVKKMLLDENITFLEIIGREACLRQIKGNDRLIKKLKILNGDFKELVGLF